MKKLIGNKLVLTLIAGVLTTAIAVGGIFAWFTATADVNQGAVDTAEVDLEIRYIMATSFEWLSKPEAIAMQKAFHASLTGDLATDAGLVADLWGRLLFCGRLGESSGWEDFYMDIGGNEDIYEPDETILATPASLIEFWGPFVNKSNIPVYVRVKAPEIYVRGSASSRQIPAAVYAVTNDNQREWLVDGGDGYYYYTKPRGITEDTFTPNNEIEKYGDNELLITVVTYVPADLDNTFQAGTVGFDALEFEIIQATNNAAILGWNPVNPIEFEPYVDPNA